MNVSSSDPGTSGIITPYCKDIKGLYFSDEQEPEDFIFEFMRDINIYRRENEDCPVYFNYTSVDDYYDKQTKFKEAMGSCKLREKYYVPDGSIFIHIDVNDEDSYL